MVELDFDEDAYIEAHQDVADAVISGSLTSGESHFHMYGQSEGRGLRNRTNPARGRILIAGTGRTGTTLLVQLFTSLQFYTGFSLDEAMTLIDPISNAGLEHRLSPDAPLIVKSPWLVESLSKDLSIENYNIAFAIVPMRKLIDAAESRRRVSRIALQRGENPMNAKGGLWLTDNFANQEQTLLSKFYDTVFSLVQNNIRPIFLNFPKFCNDYHYLYYSLKSIWKTYGVSERELQISFEKIVDTSKINFK